MINQKLNARAIEYGKRIIPCRPDDVYWSDLERLEIDLEQGPEFKNEYDLVRKLEAQLRKEFGEKSVSAPQSYTREQTSSRVVNVMCPECEAELKLDRSSP